MHPVLLQLRVAGHDVALRAYGVFIAAGFVVGVLVAAREARRAGEDPERVRDLCFWILLAALAGSRLAYVATNPEEFRRACAEGTLLDCTRPLQLWEGGLVFYGGLFAAAAAALRFTRRRGMRFLATADLLVPALAIGHAIGRVGCWLAGCCFGKASGSAWAMRFPSDSLAFQALSERGHLSGAATFTPPLHPTQLYEAAGELALFGLLVALRPRKRFHGQLAAIYLGGYAVLRAAVELFRGDAARRYVITLATPSWSRALGLDPAEPLLLSTSQLGSLLLLAVLGALLALRRRRATAP